VLFLCYGNICRSPYAAAAARRQLPSGIRVGSAGFFGPDRPAPSEAREVAAERGADLSPHRSRQLTANMAWSADLIVVMEARQRRKMIEKYPTIADRVILLGDLDPQPINRRDVLDPFGQPVATFRSCFDRIERCVDVLAGLWNGETHPNRLG
jgi:protein-tyrosine phosphatase